MMLLKLLMKKIIKNMKVNLTHHLTLLWDFEIINFIFNLYKEKFFIIFFDY